MADTGEGAVPKEYPEFPGELLSKRCAHSAERERARPFFIIIILFPPFPNPFYTRRAFSTESVPLQ